MYDREDLTFIYPVARGCAPVFVTILSFIFFKDSIPFFGLVGILIICVALLLISISNFNTKIDYKTIGISIFIAFVISVYTFSDGAGVRSVNNSLSFIVWNFFLGGWISIGYVYLTRRQSLFSLKIRELFLILCATVISFSANAIIICIVTLNYIFIMNFDCIYCTNFFSYWINFIYQFYYFFFIRYSNI